MLTLLSSDCDLELFQEFIQGGGKIERVWVKEGRPLNDELFQLIGSGIPIFTVRAVDVFNRNDQATTNRGKISLGMVNLPAVQVLFNDCDRRDCWYTGLIQGEENVLVFLRRLRQGGE